jgi:NTE family protein
MNAAAPPRRLALVLSGGLGLGAWEAGASAALEEAGLWPDRLVGSSAGAVVGAILAGNRPERGVERLRAFWASLASDPAPFTSFWFGPPPAEGAWRRLQNAGSALQNLLLGRPGLYRPRLLSGPALHDLSPLAARLPEFVDFARLNGPEAPRLAIAATDVESGERVVFDTARGDRIGVQEVLASCALLPLLAPVEVGGRLLGDGGLSANLPLDLALEGAGEVTCLAAELFARRGSPPPGLSAAAARAGDLVFGNQTRQRVEALRREHRLRRLLERAADRADPEVAAALAEAPRTVALALMAYRGGASEAGVIKPFDFSPATLGERWDSGAAAMRAALARLDAAPPAPGSFTVHDIEG